MRTLFLTGFPGFLGSALLPRLLERYEGHRAVCLVQERYLNVAREKVRELERRRPGSADRVRLVPGDLTRPALGLAEPDAVAATVRHVHHVAALYDVTAPRDRIRRVNVGGTRNVLDFAERCPGLERLHYVSTCYVSGRHPGVFTEDHDLADAGPFNNAYEETKHAAEAAVRERMEAGLPATVYRPSIVVGDQDTGRTQKFDGPYFVIRFLMRQPGVAVLPLVGQPDRIRANVVPRDFVADAIVHLAGLEASEGRVYHLADPAPLTVREMVRVLGGALGKRVLEVPVPHRAARWALRSLPGLERWLGIPAEALDYFTHPTRYDTSNARRDLEGSGIRAPRFPDYVDALVDFLRHHPEIGARGMA